MVRALFVGDYVTPSSGEYAGQLGPWADLVSSTGLEPRSTPIKWTFVIYGLIALFMVAFFTMRLRWAWWGMVGVCVLGLWYLPFGTLANIINLALLLLLSKDRSKE